MRTLKTTDYGKFNAIKGNRAVDTAHVARIKNSILENNLLEFNPILVNNDFLVIDGQHRLMAAQELEVPIYYTIADGDLKTVQLINNNSKAWTLEDYVESYIELGYQDYIKLKEFRDKWGISYTTAADIIGSITRKTKNIKDGSFTVASVESGDSTMLWVMAFSDYTDSVTIKQRNFIAAVKILMETEQITLSGVQNKLKSIMKRIYRQVSIKEYLREIEKTLNYRSRSNFIRLV